MLRIKNIDDLKAARSSGANLRGANLSEADLRWADLRWANLSEANLRGANLSEADLSGAVLSEADLRRADLSGANLRRAVLRGANLSEAVLSGAVLSEAVLSGANLSGANLSGADLRWANLSEANLRGANLPAFQIPQDGTLTVWKKVRGGLAKLEIPPSARRTATPVGRKCRAEFALVLEAPAGAVDTHTGRTLYIVGQIVRPDQYDDDIRRECTNGIHFFLTREEAEAY